MALTFGYYDQQNNQKSGERTKQKSQEHEEKDQGSACAHAKPPAPSPPWKQRAVLA